MNSPDVISQRPLMFEGFSAVLTRHGLGGGLEVLHLDVAHRGVLQLDRLGAHETTEPASINLLYMSSNHL